MNGSASEARPLLVGVDGSEVALAAVRWAAAFAARLHAPLRLAYATPPLEPYIGELMVSTSGELTKEMKDRGRAYLDAATTVADEAQPELTVDSVLVESTFSDFCAVESAYVQMIVLGSRRSGLIRDLTLGGESIRILNHADCPVLLWRDLLPTAPLSTRPVVVGIDDSPAAKHALIAAFDYAGVLGAPLVVAHFWRVGGLAGGWSAGLFDWQEFQNRASGWLNAQIEPLCDKYPSVEVQRICYEASPAVALQSFSSSAQMVVVGTRGHNRVIGSALGAVSQNLAHHSDCSVLVVH
ncbi:universal stress protein [Williamsia sp.]|uniref:universal stress protein n=1 Tax=Williamsia sp. TaxID=1872085 RepID=UPI001A30D657|nr:universal stress protein [Williamsia sp.]MBJ7291743.1 universal stress protein [Williamsia sp.]